MNILFGKFYGLTEAEEDLLSRCYDIEFSLPSKVHTIGKEAFYNVFSLDAIKIHFGVKVIEESAFENCTRLHHFIFEHGAMLTKVGDRAFYGCEKLTNIEFPLSLKSLGSSAFENCTELQTVTFEEDSFLNSIGDNAFKGCTYLTAIVIPKHVTKIGKDVFKGCSNLTIFCEREEKFDSWPENWNNNCPVIWGCKRIEEGYYSFIYGEKNNKVYAYIDKFNEYQITKFEIPNKVDNKEYILKGLNMSLFRKNEVVRSIVLPSCVSYLGPYTFYKCIYLESVSFDKGINIPSIGNSAFCECRALKSIDIPSSVTYIGGDSFAFCNSLYSITIPSNVEEVDIASFPFNNCHHLGEIINKSKLKFGWMGMGNDFVHNDKESRISITSDGYVIRTENNKEEVTLIGYTKKDKDIVIPNIVTVIRGYAFYQYEFINSITIPVSVSYIQNAAFMGINTHNKIETIKYEGTVEEWNKIKKDRYWHSYLPVAFITCKNGKANKSGR